MRYIHICVYVYVCIHVYIHIIHIHIFGITIISNTYIYSHLHNDYLFLPLKDSICTYIKYVYIYVYVYMYTHLFFFHQKTVFAHILTKTLRTNLEAVRFDSGIQTCGFLSGRKKDSHCANESTTCYLG